MYNLKNKISTKETFFIEEGKKKHDFFEADIEDALTNNVFGDHYLVSSRPGTGKTETTRRLAEKLNINMIKFEGSQGLFAFCADVATVLINAPKDDSKIYCQFDDCDSLFEKGDNLNTIKGLFDKGRNVLAYRRQLGPQYARLDDTQKAAIDEFVVEGRGGFAIPTDRFVFITLTNKAFPTSDDCEKATDDKRDYKYGLNAIRRRVQYIGMDLETGIDWGYCAHVLLTSNLVEKFYPEITEEEKIEILKFTSPTNNWSKMTERNLSVFEKMAKDMVRFPENYYDRWITQYIITK
jgi:hypothetical protein